MLKENKSKYIWVLISLFGLVLGSVGLLNNCVGIFYSIVSEDLNLLSGTFVLHNTISALTMAIVAVWVAKILKEENFKMVLWIGVSFASIASVLMGFSSKIWQFYILGMIRGIGMSTFAFVVVSRVINYWYTKNNGTITSIVFAFSGVGGALFSPLLSYVIEHMGWRIGYIVMGILVFVLALPALLIPFTIDPTRMGILPYGGLEEKKEEVSEKKKTALLSKSFFYIATFSLCVHVTGAIMQHLSSIALTKGYSLTVASLVVSTSMIGNIISKFAIGLVADKIGVVKANIITIVLNIVAGICLIVSSSYIIVMTGGFLYGFVYAETAVGLVLIARKVFGKEKYDQVYPVLALIGNGSFAISATLIGYLYDFSGTYNYALIIGIILMLISMFCVIVTKDAKE